MAVPLDRRISLRSWRWLRTNRLPHPIFSLSVGCGAAGPGPDVPDFQGCSCARRKSSVAWRACGRLSSVWGALQSRVRDRRNPTAERLLAHVHHTRFSKKSALNEVRWRLRLRAVGSRRKRHRSRVVDSASWRSALQPAATHLRFAACPGSPEHSTRARTPFRIWGKALADRTRSSGAARRTARSASRRSCKWAQGYQPPDSPRAT